MYRIIILIICLSIILNSSLAWAEEGYFRKDTWQSIYNKEEIVDYPVIFIHGIGGKIDFWKQSMKTIKDNYYKMKFKDRDTIIHDFDRQGRGYSVWGISYYSNQVAEEILLSDLDLYAWRVKKMIAEIKRLTGKDKVIIIAHSMGGVVARRYMTLDQESWNSVYKILTVGTPNQGVSTSIGIVGQLEDLKEDSKLLNLLTNRWEELSKHSSYQKWGVIGAIDKTMSFNSSLSANATDSAGPGFVTISSAIPYEWQAAIEAGFNKATYNTSNFGFRLVVDTTHMGLLFHPGTFKGIDWALH
ncbi:esterase/lipase family protein [Orenia marismortui]|uniref:PGAP1-like protein n=1 Tax=Orenia marismortui TaxID=46469 RepID=A0A4R8GZX6_9FIRM|nr:alpha/beta fold hydrolase [Orenia marismortui]TDX52327.1 PGAP1-like protein [Orenia marismortui]